jgi:hypothetical protein
MIRISCTNCKTVLSIDDAFAGGVCRCQHCGTIQTVPAHLRDTAKVAASGQAMGGSKSLYQHGDARSGTGLDDLASVVVSSGLSSSRLTRPAGGPSTKLNLVPLIVGGGVVIAVLIVIIIYLATRTTTPPAGTAGGAGDSSVNQTAGITPAPVVGVPNFCGTTLDGNTIIYLLDCGDATKDYIGELKDATIKSIASLSPDRKFQILFWNDGIAGSYPINSTAYATKDSIDSAQKAIADVAAYGQSDVKTALTKALAQQPDEIVLATAKGWQLDVDPAWLDAVMAVRGSSTAKFITYSLGSADNKCETLRKLAEKTGGSYHEATQSELRSFGQ